MLSLRSGFPVLCFPHALLSPRSAFPTLYFPHALLSPRSAFPTLRFPHVLLSPRSAFPTLYFPHALLTPHSAFPTLRFPHALLSPRSTFPSPRFPRLSPAFPKLCFLQAQLSPRSAFSTLCFPHALLSPRSAFPTLCFPHALLSPRSAFPTLCFPNALLFPRSALPTLSFPTLCFPHALLSPRSAFPMLCFPMLCFPHAWLSPRSDFPMLCFPHALLSLHSAFPMLCFPSTLFFHAMVLHAMVLPLCVALGPLVSNSPLPPTPRPPSPLPPLSTSFGVFRHSEWVGWPLGSRVRAAKGGGFVHLRAPLPALWTKVTCAELRAEFETNGIAGVASVHERDIQGDGFPPELHGTTRAAFLDLPCPWLALPSASACLLPGGRVCSFSPCMEQVQRCSHAICAHCWCNLRFALGLLSVNVHACVHGMPLGAISTIAGPEERGGRGAGVRGEVQAQGQPRDSAMVHVQPSLGPSRDEPRVFGLDKFNGDNFAEWSFKMENMFDHYDLLEVMEGLEKCPENDSEESPWVWKSAQGYLLLGQALGSSQICYIKPFQREPEKGPKAWALKEKVDNKEQFAPVAKPTTLRTLLAGAAMKGWVVKQMDVTTAFLNGILEEEIFMA
ncbi:unnamed protein product [Closterium sp. NIES-53]